MATTVTSTIVRNVAMIGSIPSSANSEIVSLASLPSILFATRINGRFSLRKRAEESLREGANEVRVYEVGRRMRLRLAARG